ncbi:MAG TPA: cation-translocating P-type ATPase, partial [Vulgatibacter sp.]|nr:cation-translocating P-type ATPase [Vulgatibacter sp.]
LLLAAVAVSIVAWFVQGAQGWPIDAVVIAAIVVLNAVLGFIQEARAANAVAALQRMTAPTSSVVRDGRIQRVPTAELVRGDLVVLAEGDFIGADARLISCSSLFVNEASLTGESHPVEKRAGTLAEPAPLGDRWNMAFKGTAVTRGTGRGVVVATGMETEMGSIAAMLESIPEQATPLQREVSHLGRTLGLAVIGIAALVVAVIFLVAEVRSAGDVVSVLLLGVSLAVAAVPEGLPAILSVILALGVQRMARKDAIVKRLSSVETLGSATVIGTDKTGTLTRGEMTIVRAITPSGSASISGTGYLPEGEVSFDEGEEAAARDELAWLLSGGSIAGDADLRQVDGAWAVHGDPSDAAFLVAEQKLGVARERAARWERRGEIPFTSERRLMSVGAHDRERGSTVLFTKGAPDVVVARCTRLRERGRVLPLDGDAEARIRRGVASLADAALRTLSVAHRELEAGEAVEEAAERDLVYLGTVGIIDPPREGVREAVAEARRAGIRILMITGDHPRTAARIAADLGIAGGDAPVVTGVDLDRLDDEGFAEAARRSAVFARVAPAHKLGIVRALQADGERVAMTGDGVNDAPALEAADIGVAMGITGTEVTREAGDLILADDDFTTIVAAVREGRRIFDNVGKVLRYLISSNVGEVLTVFFAVVLADLIGLTQPGGGVVLPLLATQILWINLITDSAPALAMGVDPSIEDVMARPPRARSRRMVDARMWFGAVITGLVMAASTLAAIDLYLPGGLFDGDGDLTSARTAGFTVLVLAQLFNCLVARSDEASAFRRALVNPLLWGAIALSILLQVAVVHLGFLNVAFGTRPLDAGQWLVCVALASAVLWVGELRKLVTRRA